MFTNDFHPQAVYTIYSSKFHDLTSRAVHDSSSTIIENHFMTSIANLRNAQERLVDFSDLNLNST
jgi:hypothetical protein